MAGGALCRGRRDHRRGSRRRGEADFPRDALPHGERGLLPDLRCGDERAGADPEPVVADVFARDLHGLPVLRAARLHRRCAAGGAGDLRQHDRQPAAAEISADVRSLTRSLRPDPIALSLQGPPDHPAVHALVDLHGLRLRPLAR